ncbi:MAG: hypothetical protein OQK12_12855 [Motiliproteus sp.]|nr:hypothetical protein [Motiliproteus sp.]MCW9053788.1 hypothetical protein [Motiliproteus sp.]
MPQDDTIPGLIILLALLLFALWRQRRDARIHGNPNPSQRRRTYFFTFLWFALFLAVFQLSPQAYLVASIIVLVLCHLLGLGLGPQGIYRQLRGSAFIGWVLSLPFCFLMWINAGL